MVPKEQYGRANGMMSLIEMGPGVLAPLLAGALLPFIQLTGIMLIDVATFVLAVGALAFVFVPQPARTEDGQAGPGRYAEGSRLRLPLYPGAAQPAGIAVGILLRQPVCRPGQPAMAPMILARTNNNGAIFASVLSAGAIGGIMGGLVMSAWGGFKRRVHGVLLGWIAGGLLGPLVMGLGRDLPVWIIGSVLGAFVVPIVNGSNQAIWQAKVAPDVQGRVFATRRLIAWTATPITPIIAGLLADKVLEPGMQAGGALAGTFGGLVGAGPGAGMALLLVISGLAPALIAGASYLIPVVRDAESRLPDHDAAAAAPADAAADRRAQAKGDLIMQAFLDWLMASSQAWRTWPPSMACSL